MMKRVRIDGQVSREEYSDKAEEENADESSSFSRAPPSTLASRKKVSAVRPASIMGEFGRHMRALNRSFYQWAKTQLLDDDSRSIADAAQDYVDYATQLQERYLRSAGEVFTFGSGDCGQLAHGVSDDGDLMVRFPRIVYSLRDKRVCLIACGGLHNAAVTEDGRVYSWGCNDEGALGRVGEESSALPVRGAIEGVAVLSVACGDGQTVAVASCGSLYVWGSYKDKEGKKFFHPPPPPPSSSSSISGEREEIRRQQDEPMKLIGVRGAIEAACGSSFCLVRCDDGALLSFGIGECGELGRTVPPLKKNGVYDEAGILAHHLSPGPMHREMTTSTGSLVANPGQTVRDAKAIGCGAYHSIVVTVETEDTGSPSSSSSVLACGLNNYGQLGTGDLQNRATMSAVLAPEGSSFVAVRGGVHHSIAVTSAGGLYAWGRGDSGQLGVKTEAVKSAGGCVSVPTYVAVGASEVVTAVSCGGNHNLALTASNSVYTWGYGEMLALGHGEERDEETPLKLAFKSGGQNDRISNIIITQVAGGGQHSAVLGKVKLD